MRSPSSVTSYGVPERRERREEAQLVPISRVDRREQRRRRRRDIGARDGALRDARISDTSAVSTGSPGVRDALAVEMVQHVARDVVPVHDEWTKSVIIEHLPRSGWIKSFQVLGACERVERAKLLPRGATRPDGSRGEAALERLMTAGFQAWREALR